MPYALQCVVFFGCLSVDEIKEQTLFGPSLRFNSFDSIVNTKYPLSMSRTAKRDYERKVLAGGQTASEESTEVKIFAWSDVRSGYRVVHSPRQPVCVFRAFRPPGSTGHPTEGWTLLADEVRRRHPSTEASYLIDVSHAGMEEARREEAAAQDRYGPLLRRTLKVLKRLNPDKGCLVAAGPSALLALKLATCVEEGFTDLFDRIILFVPPSPPPAETVLRWLRRQDGSHLPSRREPIHLVVASPQREDEQRWAVLLHPLTRQQIGAAPPPFASLSFELLKGTKPSIFRRLAELSLLTAAACDGDDSTATQVAVGASSRGPNRSEELPVYQIHFMINKFSKQIEQQVERCHLSRPVANASPATESSDSDDDDDTEHTSAAPVDGGNVEVAAVTPVATIVLPCEIETFSGPRAVELAGWYDFEGSRLGTAQGWLDVHAAAVPSMDATALRKAHGKWVHFSGVTQRDATGHAVVLANTHTVVTKPRREDAVGALGATYCKLTLVPPLFHSVTSLSVGCALIRGRKLALVRVGKGRSRRLIFPSSCASGASASFVRESVTIACKALDVTPDNLAALAHIPPIAYYPAPQHQVLLFVAVATYEPLGGTARDATEEVEVPEDEYDWLSARQCRAALTPTEAPVIDDIIAALRRSHDAQLYRPPHDLGLFGSPCATARQRLILVACRADGLAVAESISRQILGGAGGGRVEVDGVATADNVQLLLAECRRQRNLRPPSVDLSVFLSQPMVVIIVFSKEEGSVSDFATSVATDVSETLWVEATFVYVVDEPLMARAASLADVHVGYDGDGGREGREVMRSRLVRDCANSAVVLAVSSPPGLLKLLQMACPGLCIAADISTALIAIRNTDSPPAGAALAEAAAVRLWRLCYAGEEPLQPEQVSALVSALSALSTMSKKDREPAAGGMLFCFGHCVVTDSQGATTTCRISLEDGEVTCVSDARDSEQEGDDPAEAEAEAEGSFVAVIIGGGSSPADDTVNDVQRFLDVLRRLACPHLDPVPS